MRRAQARRIQSRTTGNLFSVRRYCEDRRSTLDMQALSQDLARETNDRAFN